MDLLLLGGNSPQNKEWIEEVRDSVKDDKTVIQYYDHWEDESLGGINLDREVEKLPETVKDLSDYAVFAKSAGMLLTLKAISEGTISPKRCIFVGSAVHMGNRIGMDLESLIGSLEMPVLFIQKDKDPAYSFAELKRLVEKSGLKDYEMIKIPGKEHHYGDIEGLVKVIREFIS